MSGIVGLIARISQCVCVRLIEAGYALRTLTIAGVAATTPAVIQTATPHQVPQWGADVLIDGAGGTSAINGAMRVVPVNADGVSLAVYALDDYGVAHGVNGAGWTSGGEVSIALTDGKILIGKQHIAEISTPPRIVFVPDGSTFGPRDPAHPSNKIGYPQPSLKLERSARAIASDEKHFFVEVWGKGSVADTNPDATDYDFEATERLYQQVIASTHELLAGVWSASSGKWTEMASAKAAINVRAGRKFTFGLSIQTPITAKPLTFAPPGTQAKTRSVMNLDGTEETGCNSQ